MSNGTFCIKDYPVFNNYRETLLDDLVTFIDQRQNKTDNNINDITQACRVAAYSLTIFSQLGDAQKQKMQKLEKCLTVSVVASYQQDTDLHPLFHGLLQKFEERSKKKSEANAPLKKLQQPQDHSAEQLQLATTCNDFVSKFFKDYVAGMNPSANQDESPITCLNSFLLNTMKTAFLPFLLDNVQKLPTFNQEVGKILLVVLKRLQVFLEDYSIAYKEYVTAFAKATEIDQGFLLTRINERRKTRDQPMVDPTKINEFQLQCVEKLFQMLFLRQNKSPEKPDFFLEAIKDNLPQLTHKLLNFFISPYFINVICFQTLKQEIQQTQPQVEAEKKQAKELKPKVIKVKADESPFEKELSDILNGTSE